MATPFNPEASPFRAVAAAPGTKAPRRVARRRHRRNQQIVWGVVAAAAVAAAVLPAAPTGVGVVDALWCALLAGGCAWAGSRSRRWAWLWSAGIVAAGAIGSEWAILGIVALLGSLVGAFAKVRSRPLGSVVGAAVGLTALHLPAQGFHGLPSLVALVALVPLFASAYERSSSVVRRRIRRSLLALGLIMAMATAVFGVSAVLARSSLNRAVHASHAGLDEIRGGQQSGAAVKLDQAAGQFNDAARLLDGFWTWPARLVPVVAQQRDALARASSAGALIARTGSVAADVAPYQQLKATDGRVDLPTVRRMQQPVANTYAALLSAHKTLQAVRSPWLLSPVAHPLADFAGQVDDALPQAQLASEALAVAPGMLGAGGRDQTYLILFTNPAESRFLGGFTGSFGILTAHDGKVSFTVGDRIAELFPGAKGAELAISGQSDFLARYARYDPAHNLQNLTVSPDLPTDAQVTRSLFQQYYGTSLDGILVVDPYALAALLKLTGPVQVDGLPQALTADNAASYLIVQQYVQYGNSHDDRKDVLAAAGRATFKALTTRSLPGPAAIGAALGPVVQQGRLLFYPFHHDLGLFQRIGTLGQFSPSRTSDFLSVRSANANPSKIDSFLTRTVDYQATYDPHNGNVAAVATVTLHNAAPSGGLPEYLIGNSKDASNGGKVPLGTNTMYLSFYSPLTVTSSTLDGRPSGVEFQTERGANVYSSDITLGPGQTTTLVLHLEGTIPSGPTYHLDVLNQPLVHDDTLSVKVVPSSPAWHITSAVGLDAGSHAATTRGPLSQNEHLAVTFGS